CAFLRPAGVDHRPDPRPDPENRLCGGVCFCAACARWFQDGGAGCGSCDLQRGRTHLIDGHERKCRSLRAPRTGAVSVGVQAVSPVAGGLSEALSEAWIVDCRRHFMNYCAAADNLFFAKNWVNCSVLSGSYSYN